MGKRNKKKRKASSSSDSKPAPSSPSSSSSSKNPLLQKQRDFLAQLSATERDAYFDDDAVTPERRAELWMAQAELGETTVNNYAWATPDDRAFSILNHFAPIIEIGCGANAYWCQQMKNAGIDVIGYDTSPDQGGTIQQGTPTKKQSSFPVRRGGPEALLKHGDRTLFLCYPDENDTVDKETGEPVSMAAACLEHYQGEYIIHVGELFGDFSLLLDQAPWGRSSGAEFQERLAAEYHCLLRAKLPNWLHTVDSISVWKRSKTTTIVFAADSDDGDESDEEVEYRHIPVEERLPVDVAAPCLAQLLLKPTRNKAKLEAHSSAKLDAVTRNDGEKKQEHSEGSKKKQKKFNSPLASRGIDPMDNSTYACPW